MRQLSPVESLDATVPASPSKAHTLRALFLGVLADGETVLERPLLAEDQRHAIDALRDLGADIEVDEANERVTIQGCGGSFEDPAESIYVGESGVTARMILSLCALADDPIRVDGADRIREARPVEPVLDALRDLGADVTEHEKPGHLPVTVDGFVQRNEGISRRPSRRCASSPT
jgi:3-phosphoshikimate 1-carboxyvinyltransferase